MQNIGRYTILWCTLVSLGLIIYSNGGDIMGIAEWVAIGIALLGVAGGIWGQIIQFKKDAQRIESVNKTSGEVKNDTTAMKPLVENTNKNVEEMRDGLLKRENQIDSAMESIGKLMEAQIVNDAIKQKVSSVVDNPAYIQNAVNLVYEKNAALESAVAELQNEKFQMRAYIQTLESENNNLKQEKQILSNEVKNLKMQLRSNEENNRER